MRKRVEIERRAPSIKESFAFCLSLFFSLLCAHHLTPMAAGAERGRRRRPKKKMNEASSLKRGERRSLALAFQSEKKLVEGHFFVFRFLFFDSRAGGFLCRSSSLFSFFFFFFFFFFQAAAEREAPFHHALAAACVQEERHTEKESFFFFSRASFFFETAIVL